MFPALSLVVTITHIIAPIVSHCPQRRVTQCFTDRHIDVLMGTPFILFFRDHLNRYVRAIVIIYARTLVGVVIAATSTLGWYADSGNRAVASRRMWPTCGRLVASMIAFGVMMPVIVMVSWAVHVTVLLLNRPVSAQRARAFA